MDKEIYEQYRGAMAYIEVITPKGDIAIGSAFHVGEGVFITAKHVTFNNKIKSIGTTEHYNVPDDKGNFTINGQSGNYRSVSAQNFQLNQALIIIQTIRWI